MSAGKFQIDRKNGKFMGVCAGLAKITGWDATLIRVAAVVVTLAGAFPWTLIAYGIAVWIGKPRQTEYSAGEDAFTPPPTSTYELNRSMRDIDRRMAEVETYVTSANGSLAREIEELR